MEATVTEQTAPMLGRVLPLRRGGTKGGTGPQADASAAPGTEAVPPGTGPVPVPPGPGTVMPFSAADRAALVGKHWAALAASGAGQMWLHPDRLLPSMWHGRPESMDTHLAYVKSRQWVPEELRGHKSGAFLAGAGVLHYVLIAWSLKQIGLGLSAMADRAIRFYIALAVLLVFVFLIVPRIHL